MTRERALGALCDLTLAVLAIVSVLTVEAWL